MSSWKDLSPMARFSVVAFILTLVFGLVSMGIEGYATYFAVSFALPLSIDTLSGDATWPSLILAGMAWSPGFLLAALVCTRVAAKRPATLWVMYLLVLWLWAWLVWWAILTLKVVQ